MINEKQMHCWKGYKKKGTKKLPSGKIVNNCVKESIDTFKDLTIEIKFRPHTDSKIWDEIADVYINDEKKGMFGSRDGYKDDIGYSLKPNIPGIGNDTMEQSRRDLTNYIINKIRKERVIQRVMGHGASEEEANTIIKL